MRQVLVWVVAAMLTTVSVAAQSANAANGSRALEGVWKRVEVTAVGANPRHLVNPPGLFIFAKQHFSVVMVNVQGPRAVPKPAANPQNLTQAEKLERYDQWDPVTAVAGTYTVSGNLLMIHGEVAKNQAQMDGGGPMVQFTVNGDTLTLVQKSNDGKTTTTTRLTRVEKL